MSQQIPDYLAERRRNLQAQMILLQGRIAEVDELISRLEIPTPPEPEKVKRGKPS